MTDPQPTDPIDRIPLTHSVRYVVRGLPEVPNQYGPGVLAPSEITLTYRTSPDSQLGRIHAYVAGRLWADGKEIPLLPGGLYGQHYDDGVGDWPEWLAEEARLHDPDAFRVSSPPPDQTAEPAGFVLWLDASDGSVPTHDGIRWPDGWATIRHRHYGHTTTHHSPEAACQTTHGKQGRIVWPAQQPETPSMKLARASVEAMATTLQRPVHKGGNADEPQESGRV